jgi:hypothetical protein
MTMPALQQLGQLDVSAASGLVVQGDELLVVADDERRLARYALDGRALGRSDLPGSGEELPADPLERKKLKPDYESLALLPDASLLALGSGSRKRRRQAAWIDGALIHGVAVDLAPLYDKLERELVHLNIEGAVVAGGELVLGQRGTAKHRTSALIHLDLAQVMQQLGTGALHGHALISIEEIDLGALDGIAYSLTDLAVDAAGVLHFCAAAEDTDNAVDDGRCAGSIVGSLDAARRVTRLCAVPKLKIEGLSLDAPRQRWLMVADADDPAVMAPLLALPASARGALAY